MYFTMIIVFVRPDDELDSLYDSNQLHLQPEPIGDFLGNGEIQSEGIYSETGIQLLISSTT